MLAPTVNPEEDIMATLEKGITPNGMGYRGKTWNILGQVYFPKAVTNSTFAFKTNSEPRQFVPVHVHPTHDEFILVQEGVLDLKLDGYGCRRRPAIWCACRAVSRTATSTSPRRARCSGFRRCRNWKPCSTSSATSPTRSRSAHEVDFLPPEAND